MRETPYAVSHAPKRLYQVASFISQVPH